MSRIPTEVRPTRRSRPREKAEGTERGHGPRVPRPVRAIAAPVRPPESGFSSRGPALTTSPFACPERLTTPRSGSRVSRLPRPARRRGKTHLRPLKRRTRLSSVVFATTHPRGTPAVRFTIVGDHGASNGRCNWTPANNKFRDVGRQSVGRNPASLSAGIREQNPYGGQADANVATAREG